MSDKLKPCPFCGDRRIGVGYVRDGRRVFCANCMVGVCAFNPDAEKKASEHWNTRAAFSAHQPDAEAFGWVADNDKWRRNLFYDRKDAEKRVKIFGGEVRPVYTAPPSQSAPLDDELAGCREALKKATIKAAKDAVKIADLNDMVLRYAHRAEIASQSSVMRKALEDINRERERQIAKGYDARHDDEHSDGSIARAAASYALVACPLKTNTPIWPWSYDSYIPGLPRDALVKAGALIVAEIERLDRLSRADGGKESEGGE